MKKICLCAVALLFGLYSYAQPEKKDVLISFDANYYKSLNTDETENGKIDTEDKSLGLSLSVERFLSDRFSVGAGLARHWDKGNWSEFQQFTDHVSMDYMEMESNYWMPGIFCKYYFPLVNRFYLVPQLAGSYSKQRIKLLMAHAERLNTYYNTGTGYYQPTWPTFDVSEYMFDVNYLKLELTPEFAYFFAKHFGASLYLGGLRYDKASGDADSSDWTFSFKPKYWRLGVNFRF